MPHVFFAIMLSISVTSAHGEKRPGEASTNWSLSELGNSRLAEMGFVDVTAAPFFADPTGKKDATNALQKAIVFARDHQMVCFLPSGRYRVSDTLSCIQYRPMRPDGKRKGTRDYPCVLVGSRRSQSRPRIVLAPHSPGFANPEKPKYVVHFWAPGMGTEAAVDEPQPNISMNQMFIGIDIEIGKGNPGAVAIRHRAAQGSGVQDCTIYANDGYCGLEGGAGSGGSHANVTVIGGRIGADLRQTQPAPTITGFTLINQTKTALICSSRQALCAVGLIIESQTAGPVIVTKKLWGAHYGQLCLIDSRIDMKAPGNNTAIEAESSLYLNNVFIRGAKTLIKQPDKPALRSQSNGWVHIAEYAGGAAQSYHARNYGNKTFVFPAPIFVDGKKLDVPWLADVKSNQEPPADLQSRHLWTDEFPSWESPGAVNVKDEPFGAVGDGIADDTKAIQKAIDNHEIVFLPKGTYAVSKTIQLRPDTKLIGLHRCYSWLVPLDRVGGDFHDPDNPRPVVRTADDREANTVVAFLGIRTLTNSQAAYCLRWQAGRNSIFRDTNIVFSFKAPAQGPARLVEPGIASRLYNHPLVLVDGHGGGRWYNFHQESSRGQNISYRHLLINGTDEPLSMYQCNPEHARSDANLEMRGARNVTIYGIKGEYNQPIVWIRNCDNVRIFGYGGNAAAHPGHALFVVERTPDFVLANLVDSPRMPQGIPDTFFAGDGVDPRYWYMVREITTANKTVLTPPLDRPVLYKRGHVSEVPARTGRGGRAGATHIRPYSKNSSYWEYRGKPMMLIGGSDRDNIFQWALDGTKLTDHLDLLKSCGGNYVRCTMSSREYTPEGYRWDLLPYPFAKIDGKYDLHKWNETYWNKFRTFLAETKKRGIIVQLEFWDRWNESGDSRQARLGWYWSPWNPNNNVTYDWSDSPLLKEGKTDFYNAFHMAAVENDPVLLPLQQDFIKKILDEVIDGGYDHVLFQIDNESGIGDETLEPDPYWARFARNYAMSKGINYEIYVCSSRRFHSPTPYATKKFQDWDNPEVRVPLTNPAFNFCDISQNNGTSGQAQYDNILWYRSHVLALGARPINNVKCYYFNWPIGGDFRKDRTSPTNAEAGAKFWRAVFAGAASIRFHRHTPTRPGGLREGFGLSPEGQRHLKSMSKFLGAICIFSMNPSNNLLSEREENEAYCLAEPGKQYAVFFTGDGDHCVRIDLTSSESSFELRWLDVATSCWGKKATISSSRNYMLRAPGAGQWVAVLRGGSLIK
jgi:Pectate lyase superfamily protein